MQSVYSLLFFLSVLMLLTRLGIEPNAMAALPPACLPASDAFAVAVAVVVCLLQLSSEMTGHQGHGGHGGSTYPSQGHPKQQQQQQQQLYQQRWREQGEGRREGRASPVGESARCGGVGWGGVGGRIASILPLFGISIFCGIDIFGIRYVLFFIILPLVDIVGICGIDIIGTSIGFFFHRYFWYIYIHICINIFGSDMYLYTVCGVDICRTKYWLAHSVHWDAVSTTRVALVVEGN